ncbi:MAG: hypothetical protein JNM30_19170 [Rhodospirillales bacterium]|nr:hypothetical protein [Rhodospirillales bacterium]
MCFSATASFVTAAMTGAVGLVAMTRARDRRALPLAAAPLVFGVQQGIEGLLWLHLSAAPTGAMTSALAFLFLVVALVLWPVYAPVAVLLVEPGERRRRLMRLCLAVGGGVSAYMLWWILTRPPAAVIADGHIVYVTGLGHAAAIAPAYLVATSLPLLSSSRRSVVALGGIVAAGSVVAYGFYWEAFVSVWCFFAAAASLAILGHFEHAHRRRQRLAAAGMAA